MQLICPHCSRILDFAGERPVFCAYCGRPLRYLSEEQTGACNHEAATLPPTPSRNEIELVASPQTVGGYRLIERIGTGGMGVVYVAEEIASGRKVAVKLISPEFATSAEAVERFRQEGRLASMIAHPRCVFVVAADEEEGRPHLPMELVSRRALQDLVQRPGPPALPHAPGQSLGGLPGAGEGPPARRPPPRRKPGH